MYGLGLTVPWEGPGPSPMDPDFEWDVLFQTKTTGTPTAATPTITTQSPTPVYYPPSPSYSQPQYPAIPLAATLAMYAAGALLLFFLVRGIRA